MKNKILAAVCVCAALLSITACGGDTGTVQMQEQNKTAKTTESAGSAPSENDTDTQISETLSENDVSGQISVSLPEGDETERQRETESESREDIQEPETSSSEEKEESEMRLHIQAGEHLLTATLAQNSSVEALVEMLSEGTVTVQMSDYANMEKVGSLPDSLPRNDEQTSTEAGDLILYQGNAFVIYYDTNSWNFTRLGKIDDITQQELKEILGDGDVTVELSLSVD